MTVRLKNYQQTLGALRQVERGLPKLVTDDMKKAVAPVTEDAQRRITRYPGAKPTQIRPRVTGRSVFVRQNARKVSGHRGDFGLLQQRRLDEAAASKEREVIRGVEHALDRITAAAGF